MTVNVSKIRVLVKSRLFREYGASTIFGSTDKRLPTGRRPCMTDENRTNNLWVDASILVLSGHN
jgi:hypothetical protein